MTSELYNNLKTELLHKFYNEFTIEEGFETIFMSAIFIDCTRHAQKITLSDKIMFANYITNQAIMSLTLQASTFGEFLLALEGKYCKEFPECMDEYIVEDDDMVLFFYFFENICRSFDRNVETRDSKEYYAFLEQKRIVISNSFIFHTHQVLEYINWIPISEGEEISISLPSINPMAVQVSALPVDIKSLCLREHCWHPSVKYIHGNFDTTKKFATLSDFLFEGIDLNLFNPVVVERIKYYCHYYFSYNDFLILHKQIDFTNCQMNCNILRDILECPNILNRLLFIKSIKEWETILHTNIIHTENDMNLLSKLLKTIPLKTSLPEVTIRFIFTCMNSNKVRELILHNHSKATNLLDALYSYSYAFGKTCSLQACLSEIYNKISLYDDYMSNFMNDYKFSSVSTYVNTLADRPIKTIDQLKDWNYFIQKWETTEDIRPFFDLMIQQIETSGMLLKRPEIYHIDEFAFYTEFKDISNIIVYKGYRLFKLKNDCTSMCNICRELFDSQFLYRICLGNVNNRVECKCTACLECWKVIISSKSQNNLTVKCSSCDRIVKPIGQRFVFNEYSLKSLQDLINRIIDAERHNQMKRYAVVDA